MSPPTWAIVLVLTSAFALGSCRGGGASQVLEFPGQDPALPPSITIVSWNIEKAKNPQVLLDLERIIDQERPDIVFLQEAVAGLLESGQVGGYFAESWRFPWAEGRSVGVMTLSRVPALRVEPLPTKYREFDLATPKVSLATEYPFADGVSLLAVNVHLLNFEQGSTRQIGQQLEALESRMVNHRGPVIMAGDFNTWSGERLELVRKTTRLADLEEVTGFGQGRRTGDLGPALLNKAFGIDEELPLDRVFVSGLSATSARVLGFHSSDHAPILVGLEAAGQGAYFWHNRVRGDGPVAEARSRSEHAREALIYSRGRAGVFARTGQGARSVVGLLPMSDEQRCAGAPCIYALVNRNAIRGNRSALP